MGDYWFLMRSERPPFSTHGPYLFGGVVPGCTLMMDHIPVDSMGRVGWLGWRGTVVLGRVK